MFNASIPWWTIGLQPSPLYLQHYYDNIYIFLDYTIQQMWIAKTIAFFAPDECLGCGKQPKIICDSCLVDYVYLVPRSCVLCNKITKKKSLCDACNRKTGLQNIWTVTTYNDKAKQAVHRLKFTPNRSVAVVLAQCLDVVVPHQSSLIVLHAPTAPKRVRQRGFDHAKIMAKHFAKQRQLAFCDALLRSGQKRQVGATRKERGTQLRDAYRLMHAHAIKGKDVLLIDDVLTTGATLSEIAKVLKKAGAKSVSAAVFAYAPLN